MGKRAFAFLAALAVLAASAVPAAALDYDFRGQLEGYFQGEAYEELLEDLPPAARELLEELDLGGIAGTVEGLTPGSLLSALWGLFLETVSSPLRLLVSLTGMLLLCAVLESFASSLGSGTQPVFQVVAAVFTSGVLVDPVVACITGAAGAIRDFAVFILGFIPVFAGVVTASGQPMTGAAYNLFLFWMCQATAQLAASVLVPLLCAYLSLSILSVACPGLRLSGLVGGIRTFVTWSLGLILTVFIGLMSLQTAVAAGGDSLSAKTAKFFLGSLIPGVGGTLGDLFTAAQGCIRLVKGTLGAFGVAVTALSFLPVLVRTGVWYLAMGAGGLVAEILDLPRMAKLLRSISSTLGILVAVLLFDALMVIISTTMLIVAFRAG